MSESSVQCSAYKRSRDLILSLMGPPPNETANAPSYEQFSGAILRTAKNASAKGHTMAVDDRKIEAEHSSIDRLEIHSS